MTIMVVRDGGVVCVCVCLRARMRSFGKLIKHDDLYPLGRGRTHPFLKGCVEIYGAFSGFCAGSLGFGGTPTTCR